ncbi:MULTISPECIES: DUF5791 family protein [Halorussus]|uniref:DUF5791 family protein n=1 Tax=Halorussus TaxID=1070314 RepID=UPI0020A23401|nr:DUF5791 family protein [Halorussus vallis]USZ75399.1 DUF5791 family protein [Halorussus vallis]
MLYDEVDDPEETSPEQLRADYEAELADVIAAEGVDEVADASGVDRETVAALADGESPRVTVAEAAAILALDDDTPDADAVKLETRDHLLMGMTTAVLDVDKIAAEMDDMDAKEIQQKIEGRMEMSLKEFARLHHFIASQNDR